MCTILENSKANWKKYIYSFSFSLHLVLLGFLWWCVFSSILSSQLFNKQVPYLEHRLNFLVHYFVPRKKVGVLVGCTFHISRLLPYSKEFSVACLTGKKSTLKMYLKLYNEALFP